MRVGIHVRPGAARRRVGGTHDGALVVAVTEPARDGRATEAALRALAEALGVARTRLTLAFGPSRRGKVVDIEVTEADAHELAVRLARLRGPADPGPGGGRAPSQSDQPRP